MAQVDERKQASADSLVPAWTTAPISKKILAEVAAMDESAWRQSPIHDSSEALVPETTIVAAEQALHPLRLVVVPHAPHRSRPGAAWPGWRPRLHHRPVPPGPRSIELVAIRDLKHGTGLGHCPSGLYFPNPADSAAPSSPQRHPLDHDPGSSPISVPNQATRLGHFLGAR